MEMMLGIMKMLLLIALHAALLTRETFAEQVVVKQGSMKVWFFNSWQTTNKRGQMWTDPRRGNDYGDSSHVCGKDFESIFVTNHVSLSNTFAEIIHVDIEAEITECPNAFESRNNGMPCMNSYFEVYLYRRKAKQRLPAQLKDNFKANFVATYNFTNQTSSGSTNAKQNQTFSFPKKGSEGVTLGLRSAGACGSVFKIKMYYFYCENASISGVRFPRTISPGIDEREREVKGECSPNSAPVTNATVKGFCQSNGYWRIRNDTRCFCNKGYEPSSTGNCQPCRKGWYKSSSLSNKCRQCPRNNMATFNKSGCKCKNGYYKMNQSIQSAMGPCYDLPHYQLKIRLQHITNDVINMTWQVPSHLQPSQWNETLRYEVTCHHCLKQKGCNHGTSPCVGLTYSPPHHHNLTHPVVVISNIKFGVNYVFRVYPKNSLNEMVGRKKWNYTERSYIYNETTEMERIEEKGFWPYVHVVAGACAVLFLTVIILVVVLLRRRANLKRLLSKGNPIQVELPKVGRRLYIDPTIYECPEDALNEFASELERSTVVLEMLIGGGEFGDVYKGQMCCKDGSVRPVAVKTLKQDANIKSERDFLLEASIMAQFNDPNVIGLQGVITKSIPRMIIIEFMANGSLDHFLKNNDSKLSCLQLIGMARGVASGMKYLAGINFVHRDLAARNILVNERLFCKISDFGLSRALETSQGEYSTSGGKIPIRWTAPEAIEYRKFSSASDVWSYGILLWEIMSFADRPYGDWDNFKVMKEVNEGYRLSSPEGCPKQVHDLMLRCWNAVRFERPAFSDILSTIDEWITRPGLLRDPESGMTSDILGTWLQSIKMGTYAWHFLAAGYRTPAQLSGLQDSDLKEMGITLIGHRNKILKGIKALENSREVLYLSRSSSSVSV